MTETRLTCPIRWHLKLPRQVPTPPGQTLGQRLAGHLDPPHKIGLDARSLLAKKKPAQMGLEDTMNLPFCLVA